MLRETSIVIRKAIGDLLSAICYLLSSICHLQFAIGDGSTWLTMYLQDAVYAEGAFGLVEAAVRDEVRGVVAVFEAEGFDDAGGGFVGVGGIVGHLKRSV